MDGAADKDLSCGKVQGGLSTVDFGPSSNDNINWAFTQQRKYNNNGGRKLYKIVFTFYSDRFQLKISL